MVSGEGREGLGGHWAGGQSRVCSGLELRKKALQLEGRMVVGARRWDRTPKRSENAEKTIRGGVWEY